MTHSLCGVSTSIAAGITRNCILQIEISDRMKDLAKPKQVAEAPIPVAKPPEPEESPEKRPPVIRASVLVRVKATNLEAAEEQFFENQYISTY